MTIAHVFPGTRLHFSLLLLQLSIGGTLSGSLADVPLGESRSGPRIADIV